MRLRLHFLIVLGAWAVAGCGQVVNLNGYDAGRFRGEAGSVPEAAARDTRPEGSVCAEICNGACAPGGCVETLASGGFLPQSIAVDDTSVYWEGVVDQNDLPSLPGPSALVKVAKGGGAPVTLAAGAFESTSIGGALVVDATNAYWTAAGADKSNGVLKVPIGGGTTTTLFTSNETTPWVIAQSDTFLVWGSVESSSPGAIVEGAKEGGAPVTLASTPGETSRIVVDATTVYWACPGDPAGVVSVPIGGGTATTLASGNNWGEWGPGLAVDADNVYWTANGVVMKVAKAGGTPTTLVPSNNPQAEVLGLAIDATNVYWATSRPTASNVLVGGSTVLKVAKTGGTSTVLATDVGAITDLAADATSVYWSTGGTTPSSWIRKLTPSCACSSPPPDAGLPCGPTTCETGCCSQGECLAGTAVQNCGAGGNACSVCTASQTCAAGACAPASNVILFGGTDGANALSDTWTWDGTGWTKLALEAVDGMPGPGARYFASMATLNGTVLLFGGTDDTNDFGDTWTWNGKGWAYQTPVGPQPPARWQAAMAAVDDAGVIVLFGGVQSTNGTETLLGDTWTWDGTSWTQQNVSGPSPRYAAAAGFWGNGVMALFGGAGPSGNPLDGGPLGDTWTFDAYFPSWVQRTLAGPSARYGASEVTYFNVAGDPAPPPGPVLLFGGSDAEGELADTWIEQTGTGSTDAGAGYLWTAEPVAAPGGRSFAAAGPLGGSVVLFGGVHGDVAGDTWTWDGTSWTQSNVPGPSARYGAAMSSVAAP